MQRTNSSPSSPSLTRLFAGGLIIIGLLLLLLVLAGGALGLARSEQLSTREFVIVVAGTSIVAAGLSLLLPANYSKYAHGLLIISSAVSALMAADVIVLVGSVNAITNFLGLMVVWVCIVLVFTLPAASGSVRELPRTWLRIVLEQWQQVIGIAVIFLQLMLLAVVMNRFELENQAIYHNTILLVAFGFLFHIVLPMRYRISFFAALSMAAVVGILGVENGIWLLVVGLSLIGIAHLPLAFRLRAGLLLLAGVVLLLMRGSWLVGPVPAATWPILGSMFMFRLIIYLYDLKFSKKPVTIDQTLSYFFMFPNIVFPLFPVVDFNTMRRTYHTEKNSGRVYQNGATLIFKGVVQLILYRIINYYVVIAQENVVTTVQLLRYVISAYLLYLRVSGQFHLIIGFLNIFGFNLPDANWRYFLASSFTDLWRRVNIYWKDFMQKIFFYPIHHRLRGYGSQTALLSASILVIFITWLLHAYQWFWLRGSTFFVATDMLFWTILGILLTINIFYESRFGRKRSLGKQKLTVGQLAGMAVRTAGLFFTISILWSLWSSSTVADWFSLWSTAASLQGVLTLLAAFAGAVVIFGAVIWYLEKFESKPSPLQPQPAGLKALRPAFFNIVVLTGVFLLALPDVHTRLGPQVESVVANVVTSRLSARDAAQLQRGYYEDLMGVSRFNSDLWEIYSVRPSDWPLIQETELAERTHDFRIIELLPNRQLVYHGAVFSTNSLGMRDKEYSLKPGPNTFRIAILGPSYVMGSGVADDETFEWLVEERLNSELSGETGQKYEILNFGVAGVSPFQELWLLEEKVLEFEPDVLIFTTHHLDDTVGVRKLAESARLGHEIPYDYLKEIIREAGVTVGMSAAEAERRLQPYQMDALRWSYEQILLVAEANGIKPFFAYMSTPELFADESTAARMIEMGYETGFTVFDMRDAFGDVDLDELVVAEWDRHPNARGHQILADRLYSALLEEGVVFPDGGQ